MAKQFQAIKVNIKMIKKKEKALYFFLYPCSVKWPPIREAIAPIKISIIGSDGLTGCVNRSKSWSPYGITY